MREFELAQIPVGYNTKILGSKRHEVKNNGKMCIGKTSQRVFFT
jgi:hypothetical protein